jgi:hypothetical protein
VAQLPSISCSAVKEKKKHRGGADATEGIPGFFPAAVMIAKGRSLPFSC